MKQKISKFLYWTPRIVSIIFIAFLALMSLDIFGNGYTFWQTLVGLFMHNIPVFILTIVLIISWKHEWVGGIAFILAGCLYIISALIRTQFQLYVLSWILIVSGPAFVIGILFLIGWKKKRR